MLMLKKKIVTITATISITRLQILQLMSLRISIKAWEHPKNIIKIGARGKRNSMKTSKVSLIEMIHTLILQFRTTKMTRRRPPCP